MLFKTIKRFYKNVFHIKLLNIEDYLCTDMTVGTLVKC